MEELINEIVAKCDLIKTEIAKPANLSAQARVRRATLELEKLGKEYRRKSIEAAKKAKKK